MDNCIGWRLAHDRVDLVLRYKKPEHALVDDSDALRAPGTIDLSVGRTRQSLPRRNQRWTSTIPTYVFEADSGRVMILEKRLKHLKP